MGYPQKVQIGQRFDRLTVEAKLPFSKAKGTQYLCRCICGGEVLRRGSELFRTAHTGCKSCESMSRSTSCGLRTHGGASFGKTRLYRIWKGMRDRCTNPGATSWPYYGAKGIQICDAWQGFEGFRDWALSHGYADDLVIDRVDPDFHYDPSNCEWVTKSENSRRVRSGYWRSMTVNA